MLETFKKHNLNVYDVSFKNQIIYVWTNTWKSYFNRLGKYRKSQIIAIFIYYNLLHLNAYNAKDLENFKIDLNSSLYSMQQKVPPWKWHELEVLLKDNDDTNGSQSFPGHDALLEFFHDSQYQIIPATCVYVTKNGF